MAATAAAPATKLEGSAARVPRTRNQACGKGVAVSTKRVRMDVRDKHSLANSQSSQGSGPNTGHYAPAPASRRVASDPSTGKLMNYPLGSTASRFECCRQHTRCTTCNKAILQHLRVRLPSTMHMHPCTHASRRGVERASCSTAFSSSACVSTTARLSLMPRRPGHFRDTMLCRKAEPRTTLLGGGVTEGDLPSSPQK
jgi:hypothetical protein